MALDSFVRKVKAIAVVFFLVPPPCVSFGEHDEKYIESNIGRWNNVNPQVIGGKKPPEFDRMLQTMDGESNDKIIGGTQADIEDVPYFTRLDRRSNFWCGACLIHPHIVASAAHCRTQQMSVIVKAASSTRFIANPVDAEEREVSSFVRHPNYNRNTLENDIMLLFFDEPIVTIDPVPFNTNPSIPDFGDDAVIGSGDDLVIYGLGTLSNGGSISNVLMQVEVDAISKEKCTDGVDYTYSPNDIVDDVMFCAARAGKDSCNGDSGGPIVKKGEAASDPDLLVGLVSWGIECALPDYPGVYTRIGGPISDWMIEVICTQGRVPSNTLPSFCFEPEEPTLSPTDQPTAPTNSPTNQPSDEPTLSPTDQPTDEPTLSPTDQPISPTESPTNQPVSPTESPTDQPIGEPTLSPTDQPISPTYFPTAEPTAPTESPTNQPVSPTESPTDQPIGEPTLSPTDQPISPTYFPTAEPTEPPESPTNQPVSPSESPIDQPTKAPTVKSTPNQMTKAPTTTPVSTTNFPTASTDPDTCKDKEGDVQVNFLMSKSCGELGKVIWRWYFCTFNKSARRNCPNTCRRC